MDLEVPNSSLDYDGITTHYADVQDVNSSSESSHSGHSDVALLHWRLDYVAAPLIVCVFLIAGGALKLGEFGGRCVFLIAGGALKLGEFVGWCVFLIAGGALKLDEFVGRCRWRNDVMSSTCINNSNVLVTSAPIYRVVKHAGQCMLMF